LFIFLHKLIYMSDHLEASPPGRPLLRYIIITAGCKATEASFLAEVPVQSSHWCAVTFPISNTLAKQKLAQR
jgi:hypothetical protein